MIDRDIVATMLSADPAGLANAYDAYAGKLHAYCWTLLRDHDAAADAVQDTFIVADKCISQLRDPDRLRPWLYAIARNESLRQLRASARTAPFEEAGDVIDESAADVGRDLDQEQTRELVWAAAQGLNTGEYEVLELNLRHELEGADLAAALGVSRNHAHALLSRARAQFEVSLAALLVARTGRGNCETLDGLLSGWDGGITALLRKRINRHIEQCDVCGERKKRELRPALLMSSLPFMLAPVMLRDKVLQLVADPTTLPYRQMVVNRAGPFGPDGFVKALQHPGSSTNPNQNGQGGQGGQSGQGGPPEPGPGVAAAVDPPPLPAWTPPELPAVAPWSPAADPGEDPDESGGGPHDRHSKKRVSVSMLVLLLLLVIAAGTLLYLKLPTSPAANGSPTVPPITALTTLSDTTVPTDTDSATATPTMTVTLSATPTVPPTAPPTTPRTIHTTSPVQPPPPTQKPTPTPTPTPLGTLVASPTSYQFEYNANGGLTTGTITVTESGGTLADVVVSNPSTALTVTESRIVEGRISIYLATQTTRSPNVTLTISAANTNTVTVTVEWPPS